MYSLNFKQLYPEKSVKFNFFFIYSVQQSYSTVWIRREICVEIFCNSSQKFDKFFLLQFC